MPSSEDASVLVWAEGLFSCLWLCLAGILESSIIDCPSELFHTARLKLNRPQLSPLERICAEVRTAVVVIERWGWQTNSFQHLVWRESANLYLDLEKWMKPVFFWWVEKVHWRDWYIHAHSTDMFLGLISRQNIVLKKKKKRMCTAELLYLEKLDHLHEVWVGIKKIRSWESGHLLNSGTKLCVSAQSNALLRQPLFLISRYLKLLWKLSCTHVIE